MSQLKERRKRHRQSLARQERRHDEWLALEKEYRLTHYGVGGYDWVDKNRAVEARPVAAGHPQVGVAAAVISREISSDQEICNGAHEPLPPHVLWETRERAKWRRDFLSWEEIRESELPSEDAFAQLIRATARIRPDDWFGRMRCAEFFKDMWGQATPVIPTLKSYNALISTLSKYHALDMTVGAFDQMMADKIDPDANTYGYLIAAYLASPTVDRIDKAISLFEEMMDDGELAGLDYLTCDGLIEAFDTAAQDPDVGLSHQQTLLAMVDLMYSKAVQLELYGGLESVFAENIKKKKKFKRKASGGGNSHGVFHLEGKPPGVAKAAIRHLLGTLRQDPALTGLDVLVCTDMNTRQKRNMMQYCKEELSGPAMSERREQGANSRKHFDENKDASISDFWLLHGDVAQWCAWPPRRTKHLRNLVTSEEVPSRGYGKKKKKDAKTKKNLMGFPGPVLSPPDMPSDGDGIAKFQVVSKDTSADVG